MAGTGVAIVVAGAGPAGPTLALAQGPLGQKSPTPMQMSAQPLKVSWGPQPSRPVGSVRQASVWTSALCAPTPQLLPVVYVIWRTHCEQVSPAGRLIVIFLIPVPGEAGKYLPPPST